MLGRTLDDTYAETVRRDVTTVTVARLAVNGVYRFAPPFLATIARGLDVTLADLGVAVAVTELCGLLSPVVGRTIDHVPRRTAMAFALLLVATGAAVSGAAPSTLVFGIGLFVVALGANISHVAIGAWVADDVPYDRRSRVVGLTETAWAGGLLIVVSLLGLVSAVGSWRWSYATGAALAVGMAVLLRLRLPVRPAPRRTRSSAEPVSGAPVQPTRLGSRGWLAVVGLFGLMASAQAIFVTFGAWLEDSFGFTSTGLALATFMIGGFELLASTTSARRTDRWGKERSVIGGTAIMIPAATILALFHGNVVVGLVLVCLFVGAFEFAIVSMIPIGGDLIAGRPARGISSMIAFGTVGRAVAAIPATALYERHGLAWPCVVAIGFAGVTTMCMAARRASDPAEVLVGVQPR